MTIEWTDVNWNPVTGCTLISRGCNKCYARRMALRQRGRNGYPADDPFRVVLRPERLDQPLRWRKPRRVFVCSMSDLLHDDVPDEFIDRVFAVMALCPQHTFVVLTKRPQRMLEYLQTPDRACHRSLARRKEIQMCVAAAYRHNSSVILGVSVEDQATANERIPLLLKLAAAGWRTVVSAEPLLGPIEYFDGLHKGFCPIHDFPGGFCHGGCPHDRRINWVIVGAETGPGARPCELEWVRSIVRQCKAATVPPFVKAICVNGKLLTCGKGQPWPDAWPKDLQVRQGAEMKR